MIKYRREIRHKELNKYRCITGTDEDVVENKARAQLAVWNEQWKTQKQKLETAYTKEAKKKLAAQRTMQAEKAVEALQKILVLGLAAFKVLPWKSLRDCSPFAESKPSPPTFPTIRDEPQETDLPFVPTYSLLDHIFSCRKQKKKQDTHETFLQAQKTWTEERQKLIKDYEDECKNNEAAINVWEERKYQYAEQQNLKNQDIDRYRENYQKGEATAVQFYMDAVLNKSAYPEPCNPDFDGTFIAENSTYVIDYILPALSLLPNIKQVRYVASRDAIEEGYLRQNELNALYDGVCYQICLRTVFEIFSSDTSNIIKAVIFNGWVNFVDPANGKEVHSCILSLQAKRDEFSAINLQQVDPRACFKSLKGVGSPKLHEMAAVMPLLIINRDDKRFVNAVDVAEHINAGTNLAAIGWEDFEQLVREIFEKEFSSNGGEVKVTQASRDGGVDAIAFDPDPIRGGKIVIQAKRYTNTVDVSAVRDLYGTVMNEGATKGILVTTSSFGPDAYSFAKDKPLTLLDGGNLLYLLERHGHKAYINLLEAKKINNDLSARNHARTQ